jgi:glucose-1-phosphate adenylyltransferase
MGSDYYEREGTPLKGVGKNCNIDGAILDKNVTVGDGTVIKPFPRGTELDKGDWVVQDGIVVIPKDVNLPPGTYIGPEQE